MMDMKPAKQLQSEIEGLLDQLEKKEKRLAEEEKERYDPSVASLCSRLMARQAVLTEVSSRRLVCLTWGLASLTFGLLVFTILTCFRVVRP
jgi:CII-binding regulator of phage lambda lysogenization HflD